MKKQLLAIVMTVAGLATSACAQSCPAGLVKLGALYFETNAENGHEVKTTALTPGFVPDQSYQQQTLKAAGGGSDTHSNLSPQDVPAGYDLEMSGSESSCKGWSVNRPVSLTAVKLTGAHVDQFGFAANMYCTRGSGEQCKYGGGCNANVVICGKPAPAPLKRARRKPSH